MEIRLYNTLTRAIETFTPIEERKVGLYTCGPTVWNYAHIGNLRTYVFEDILRRALEGAGYSVRHVMNITDVGHLTDDADDGEDKMLRGARLTGKSVWEIAEHYTDVFFSDAEKLNVIPPHVTCRATEHINDMIQLIQTLENKEYVYVSGGNVYFDTSRFEGYGKLALLDRQDLKAGARIAVDQNKRNPADFVLWFTQSKFKNQIMLWDSPWGRGYPGWHIECSAMSMKYLGEHFDIHCGGVDHIPVHHTNEIAQAEGATGKKWVNIWMHGEYLLSEKEKMAKSGGNFLTLAKLAEEGFDPLDYRYFCLGAHYRTQLQYSGESMEAAKSARRGVLDRLLRIREQSVEPTDGDISPRAFVYQKGFEESVAQDLNMPKALSELWNLLKDTEVKNGDKLHVSFEMDRILGLSLEKDSRPEADLEKACRELIRKREEARKSGNYKLADELRDQLKNEGILVEDTVQGTRWQRVKE